MGAFRTQVFVLDIVLPIRQRWVCKPYRYIAASDVGSPGNGGLNRSDGERLLDLHRLGL
jgi:hypothetical protein